MLDLLSGFSQPFTLPSTLFNYAKSLVVLKLKEGIVLNPPSSSFGFPSLKTLLLHRVRYAYTNGDTLSELLSCCPVLQNLYLQTYTPNYDNNFKIIVPTLKTLHLSLASYRDCRLEINAPALKYLHFRAWGVWKVSSNTLLSILNNIIYFFTYIYIKNIQTTLLKFL